MMTVYLTGCAVAFVLCVILHIVEYYEGIPKTLAELVIVTLLVVCASWLSVMFVGGALVITLIDKMQDVTIVRKSK